MLVKRAEFREQLISGVDAAWAGRFEEWEGVDIAQAQRLHAQNNRGERGAQNFRCRVFRARVVIGFAVKPNAHAAGDPPATPGTLLRRGARNFFHLQLIDFAALAKAIQPRQAAVDNIADARHRKRSLRHVGREDNAPRRAGLEHAILLGNGKAREQ